jgi:hypothetical protein
MRSLIFIAVASILANGPAIAQSLKEQAACAAQAQIFHRAYDNTASVPGFKFYNDWYQSHYNTKLNKCLVLINQMTNYKGQTIMTAELDDAFDRRVFANYIWNMKTGNVICQLTPTLDKTVTCSSKQEFDSFVAKYMEQ